MRFEVFTVVSLWGCDTVCTAGGCYNFGRPSWFC